jgi:hypothetical protein
MRGVLIGAPDARSDVRTVAPEVRMQQALYQSDELSDWPRHGGPLIDARTHFRRLDREEYPWLSGVPNRDR